MADIYIKIKQLINYKVGLKRSLLRVIIHGLHLCDTDKTVKEKEFSIL